jgi:RimJ/RimL family protein N-acetyltransferase
MELTVPMAISLLPHLAARDRAEVMRTHPDLEQWARERCALPGNAWALVKDDQVLAIGGVVHRGGVGTIWLAGRAGWTRHVKHALRVWREILAVGFNRLECKACADNQRARRFAERVGFQMLYVKNGFVHYGMAP